MSHVITAPHCPRCSRYMADVRAVFKADLLQEVLSIVYGHCVDHGLQEVAQDHCEWCADFFNVDTWQPSYESVKVRETSKL